MSDVQDNLNQLSPGDRYVRDPVFRQLVDVLEYHIHRGNYTPTELREAAILAATIHHNHTIRKYVWPTDSEYWKAGK